MGLVWEKGNRNACERKVCLLCCVWHINAGRLQSSQGLLFPSSSHPSFPLSSSLATHSDPTSSSLAIPVSSNTCSVSLPSPPLPSLPMASRYPNALIADIGYEHSIRQTHVPGASFVRYLSRYNACFVFKRPSRSANNTSNLSSWYFSALLLGSPALPPLSSPARVLDSRPEHRLLANPIPSEC